MSDIFDNIELSDSFDGDQLLTELFKRNLQHQAEIKALSAIVCELLRDGKGITEDQAAKIIKTAVSEYQEEVFVNNEFLAEAWRKKNNKDLGL